MKRVFDDLSVFCAVVEHGSLKGASEKTGIPHSTVSRRIEALESALGLKLLYRTTRDVRVTSKGVALFNDCASAMTQVQQSLKRVAQDEITFRGKLTISMPVRAGIDFLGSWLIDFAARYNDLSLELSLSNSNKNLVKDDIDLAFRVGPLVDSSAIAIPLWDIPNVLVCHKQFANMHGIVGQQLSKEKLYDLPCVVAYPTTVWRFESAYGEVHNITPPNSLRVDDLGLARHAVKSKQFLGMLPKSMLLDNQGVNEFEEGNLISLQLDNCAPQKRKMYAYYLGRRHEQSQLSALIDYVKNRFFETY